MVKSQLNIKLPENLLKRVKRQAMMNGNTLTDHIVNLITESLEEQIIEKTNLKTSDYMLAQILQRLSRVESAIQNYDYLNEGLTPFTDLEAIKCSEFMRELFLRTVDEKGYSSKKKAFSDLCRHLDCYEKWNTELTMRLKEVMLMEDPEPFTGNELNDLSSGDKCNCPIRFGLINWSGSFNVPSQQEICDKGVELLNKIC